MKKQILSILSTLLTICMILTMLPINALADFTIVDGAIQGQVFGAASGTEGPVGETVNVAVYAQDNPDTALAVCTTDTEGVFTLTKDGGFPAGNYTVVLTSSLYLTERKEISISSGISGYTFSRIDLRVLGKVYGTVTDSTAGAALSGVKVEAYRDSALIASTTTDVGGAYSLEGERGECQLVLSKAGYTSKTVDTKFSGPIGWELADVQMTSTGGGTGDGDIIASGNCGPESGVTWTLDSNGVLKISGEGVPIPYYDYNSYTGSYSSPWARSNNIRTVIIEDGITGIGEYAFADCSGLTRVIIGNSVTYISGGAFEYCSSLTSVTIPNGVTGIGRRAFLECRSVTSVTIPKEALIKAGKSQANRRRQWKRPIKDHIGG